MLRRIITQVLQPLLEISLPSRPAPPVAARVRIIACIDDPAVIEKILTRLDAKTTEAKALQRPAQRGLFH